MDSGTKIGQTSVWLWEKTGLLLVLEEDWPYYYVGEDEIVGKLKIIKSDNGRTITYTQIKKKDCGLISNRADILTKFAAAAKPFIALKEHKYLTGIVADSLEELDKKRCNNIPIWKKLLAEESDKLDLSQLPKIPNPSENPERPSTTKVL